MHYSFAIDISGMLPDQDSVIGLAAFSMKQKESIFKRLKAKYPKFLNRKGTKLKKDELYKIATFLNRENVKMVAIKCTRSSWRRRYSNLPKSASYKREKLYGVLYFLALEKYSKKNGVYDVVVCKDSFMKTEKAISACKKLAEYYSFTYNFTLANANQNFGIKIADYIAAIGRKFKEKTLKNFQNFYLQTTDIPYNYIRYVFELF